MTLYKELSRKIKFGILRGDYPPGSRLPSLRVLAEREKCNQATVKRAMQILGQEHLVFPRHTAGIFVTDDLLLLAEGSMAAGRLQERFPITFAPLSYHLSVLKHSGLVTAKKEGQYRLYDLNREALEGMALWLSGLVEC